MADRAANAGAQTNFFHTGFRQFADKARRTVIDLFAVQTTSFIDSLSRKP
jgi:hypothetical protein